MMEEMKLRERESVVRCESEREKRWSEERVGVKGREPRTRAW